jgi:hypothetical protein
MVALRDYSLPFKDIRGMGHQYFNLDRDILFVRNLTAAASVLRHLTTEDNGAAVSTLVKLALLDGWWELTYICSISYALGMGHITAAPKIMAMRWQFSYIFGVVVIVKLSSSALRSHNN